MDSFLTATKCSVRGGLLQTRMCANLLQKDQASTVSAGTRYIQSQLGIQETDIHGIILPVKLIPSYVCIAAVSIRFPRYIFSGEEITCKLIDQR